MYSPPIFSKRSAVRPLGIWLCSLAAALVTAFGGGSCYVLLMSRCTLKSLVFGDVWMLEVAVKSICQARVQALWLAGDGWMSPVVPLDVNAVPT